MNVNATVAILAQGTSQAVAEMQAFTICHFVCDVDVCAFIFAKRATLFEFSSFRGKHLMQTFAIRMLYADCA